MEHENRRSLLILSFTLVVVMLGYGIVLPILPFYIEALGATGWDMGLLTAISALMQLIFAPIWGSLSDRVGRKPVLLVGILGYGLTMLLFGLSTRLWMLFLARAMNGVLSSAALPTSMAIISDQSTPKERGGRMGQLGAAMGIGMILGPGLGGGLAAVSLATPFFVASGLCVMALLLVWRLLPESLAPANRQKTTAARPGLRIGVFRQALTGPLGILLLLILVVSFGMSGFQGILGLYALDKFGLDTRQVGSIWMVFGVLMMVSQGVLTGLLTRRFGEVWVIRVSLLSAAAGFGLMVLADAYLPLLLATGFLILAIALLGPSLNALIANRTTLQQGITMGVNNSFSSLGKVLGPLWAGFIFDVNLDLPFLSSTVILLLGFLISLSAALQPPPGEAAALPKVRPQT